MNLNHVNRTAIIFYSIFFLTNQLWKHLSNCPSQVLSYQIEYKMSCANKIGILTSRKNNPKADICKKKNIIHSLMSYIVYIFKIFFAVSES